jgi:hypothetical protein
MIRTRTPRIVGLAVSVCVLILALAAVALAANRGFKGKVDGGGKVDFKAKLKKGKVVQVVGSAKPLPFGHGFRWNKVPAKCPKGKLTISGHFNFPMNVGPGGKFKKSVSTSTGKTTVSGTFSSASKASGKLKFNGGVYHDGELWTGCVTNAKWSAKH